MIVVGDREFRTLEDEFFVNGQKCMEAYVNGELVYPDTYLPYRIVAVGESSYSYIVQGHSANEIYSIEFNKSIPIIWIGGVSYEGPTSLSMRARVTFSSDAPFAFDPLDSDGRTFHPNEDRLSGSYEGQQIHAHVEAVDSAIRPRTHTSMFPGTAIAVRSIFIPDISSFDSLYNRSLSMDCVYTCGEGWNGTNTQHEGTYMAGFSENHPNPFSIRLENDAVNDGTPLEMISGGAVFLGWSAGFFATVLHRKFRQDELIEHECYCSLRQNLGNAVNVRLTEVVEQSFDESGNLI